MLPGLAGKVAIVTGGARNIGRAIALKLARAGVRVAVLDLDLVGARKVAAEAAALAGGRALALQVDLVDHAQVTTAIAQVARRFGRIDILVNNAAKVGGPVCPFEKITPEQWDHMQQVSLRGAFFCTQAVLPHLLRTSRGKILNISSVVFWAGLGGCADYVAAKGGILGLTRALARELGDRRINVNAVTPGAVMTPQQRRQATPAQVASIIGKQCLRDGVRPDDIANAVLFLASSLSDAMTGQTLNVDGGWIMH